MALTFHGKSNEYKGKWKKTHKSESFSLFCCCCCCWKTLNGRQPLEWSITFNSHSLATIKCQYQCVEVIKLHNLWHRKGSLTMSDDAWADNSFQWKIYNFPRDLITWISACSFLLKQWTYQKKKYKNNLNEKARNLLYEVEREIYARLGKP